MDASCSQCSGRDVTIGIAKMEAEETTGAEGSVVNTSIFKYSNQPAKISTRKYITVYYRNSLKEVWKVLSLFNIGYSLNTFLVGP